MDLGQAETTELVVTIGSNIQHLSQLVQQLELSVAKIGGPEDGDRVRDHVVELTASANHLSKETNALMKMLVAYSNDRRSVPTLKVQRERLMGELIAVLNRLQSTQRTAAAREKESIKAVTYKDHHLNLQMEQSDEGETLERKQLQIQHEHHLNELRDRNEAMRQLDQDIGDVTQIMKDLARIVHEQGEVVDSIEANVEHASMHVQQGSSNVQRAVIYQQKARQKKFLVFFFLFLLLLIIILVLYFYAK